MPRIVVVSTGGGGGGGSGGANAGLGVKGYASFAPSGSAPVWTNISSRIRAVRVTRQRAQPGTARIVLDNRDRALEPDYTASPYYPNVRAGRQVQFALNWLGIDYPLFTGYTDRWPQDWAFMDITVPLTATDGWRSLVNIRVDNASFPQQWTGERIDAVLDAISWPGARDIDRGNSLVPAISNFSFNALDHIIKMQDTELGYFFFGKDGTCVFRDRFHYLMSQVPIATFGDNIPTELPATDAAPSDELDAVRNYVAVTNHYPAYTVDNVTGVITGDYTASGITQIVEDSASQLENGLRSQQVEIYSISDYFARDRADILLQRNKDPAYTFRRLIVEPAMDPTNLFPQFLQRELGDRIQINRRPRGGTVVQRNGHIDGIEIVAEENRRWVATWTLDPTLTEDATQYWQLGVSGKSEVGSTTKLGF